MYKKQCDMTYETVVDYEYEQKCTHSYEEECHGYGYHQECEKVSHYVWLHHSSQPCHQCGTNMEEELGDKNPAAICFGKYKIYQAFQTRAFGVECRPIFAHN